MKLRYTLAAALLLSATALTTLQSCSKDDDDDDKEPVEVCRISNINTTSGSSVSTIAITYNNDGKISTFNSTSGSSSNISIFTYSGNKINITRKNATNVVTSIDEVTLDSRGQILSIISKDNLNVVTSTTTYEYDANGKLAKITRQPAVGVPTVTTAVFSGSDLSSLTDPTSTTTASYYTDKSFQEGDYIKLFQMINYGALYIVNSHLVKSLTTDSDIINFNYDFDASGKIIKLTQTSGSDVFTYSYSYLCQ